MTAWAAEDEESYLHQRGEIDLLYPAGHPARQAKLDQLEDWYEGRELTALSSRPFVAPEGRSAWQCYWALQGERMVMPMSGVGRIKYRAISKWAKDHGKKETSEIDWLVEMVSRMDDVYLDYQEKRMKEHSKEKTQDD